jgi:chromosome segregation ATPase
MYDSVESRRNAALIDWGWQSNAGVPCTPMRGHDGGGSVLPSPALFSTPARRIHPELEALRTELSQTKSEVLNMKETEAILSEKLAEATTRLIDVEAHEHSIKVRFSRNGAALQAAAAAAAANLCVFETQEAHEAELEQMRESYTQNVKLLKETYQNELNRIANDLNRDKETTMERNSGLERTVHELMEERSALARKLQGKEVEVRELRFALRTADAARSAAVGAAAGSSPLSYAIVP